MYVFYFRSRSQIANDLYRWRGKGLSMPDPASLPQTKRTLRTLRRCVHSMPRLPPFSLGVGNHGLAEAATPEAP